MTYGRSKNASMKSQKRPPISLKHLKMIGDESYLPAIPCIEWSEDIANNILDHFSGKVYPYRSYSIDLEEPLRSSIRRFSLALDAYLESSNPVQSAGEIIYQCSRKEGASFQKNLKSMSFVNSHSGYFLGTLSESKNTIKPLKIKDIGDIFNHLYLPHFKDEEVDDYKHGFIPVKTDKAMLDKFRQKIRELLPNRSEFEKIYPEEIVMELSGSICIDSKSGKHIPQFLSKEDLRYKFATSIGRCHRTVLQVKPDGARDTVILTEKVRNSIRLLDKQILNIIEGIPEINMKIHLEELSADLQELFYDYPFILCRDIKKEAITKPRILLRIMLEELNNKYPDIEIFQNTNFYEDFSLVLETGEEVFPERGHGLGMANSLTSLMQAAIHEIVCSLEDADGLTVRDAPYEAYNDDFITGFRTQSEFDIYWDIEDVVMNGLSMIRSAEKSFFAYDSGILCEEYFSDRYGKAQKESYKRAEILFALCCVNITHAKSIISSINENNQYIEEYIDEIIQYWGIEFFIGEENLPSSLGGWLNNSINGTYLDLYDIDKYYSKNLVKAFFACNKKFRKLEEKINKEFHPPVYDIFNSYQFNIEEEYKDDFDIISMNEISMKLYQYSQNPSRLNNLWDQIKKVRKSRFNKSQGDLAYDEFLILYIEKYKERSLIPLKSMVESIIPCEYMKGYELRDIYQGSNPKLEYLALQIEEFKYPLIGNRYSLDKGNDFVPKTIHENEKSILIGYKSRIDNPTHGQELIAYSNDISFLESYNNPAIVGTIFQRLTGIYGLPILKEEFRSPIISHKKEIFGKILTYEERMVLREYKIYDRSTIKTILDVYNKYDQEFTIEEIINLIEELSLDKEEDYLQTEDKIIPKNISNEISFNYSVEDFANWLGSGKPRFLPEDINELFIKAETKLTIHILSSSSSLWQEKRDVTVKNIFTDKNPYIESLLRRYLLLMEERSSLKNLEDYSDSNIFGVEEEADY